ncbi:MAG: ferritin-like domain-containing protein [Solirubrobacteraceae bacterium]
MTTDRLKDLLQAAVELELSTIPTYLCALYSIHPDTNDEARLIIRSVVVEEMLHMVLAANVLNAIGGRPRVVGPDHAPRYPHELPDGVVLDLLPFSPAAVDAFLKVENPQYDHQALSDDDPLVAGRRPERHISRAARLVSGPATIGAFYAEIVEGLKQTAAEIGEQTLFCGDPARQVTRAYYYAGGGSPVSVTDLASGSRALDEIVEQGEGDLHSMYDPDGDLAHYFRFVQVKHDRAYLRSDDAGNPTGAPIGIDFSAVYPMLPNPRGEDYTDPTLRAASDAANRTWSELLVGVDRAFDGHPEELLPAVHSMFTLRDQVLVLLGNPLPEHGGRHAGPTFAWDPPATTDDRGSG